LNAAGISFREVRMAFAVGACTADSVAEFGEAWRALRAARRAINNAHNKERQEA
jgi:hypothetical protein